VQRTIYRETGSSDTRELLADIARLESQNATLQNQLKEMENKIFQENKEKDKVQLIFIFSDFENLNKFELFLGPNKNR
jgi:hypothetical protein